MLNIYLERKIQNFLNFFQKNILKIKLIPINEWNLRRLQFFNGHGSVPAKTSAHGLSVIPLMLCLKIKHG